MDRCVVVRRRRWNFLAVLVVLGSAGAQARAPMTSRRGADEPFLDAAARVYSKALNETQNLNFGESAYDARVDSFEELDLSRAPQIESIEKLQKIFETYRDRRFLPDPQDATFLRRLSWMYPDDGCFARAEFLGRLVEADSLPSVGKLFVFGDLRAPTPNHPSGEVQWWYHVAGAYRVGEELYVLDPSVEPKRPVTDNEWGQRIGDHGRDGATTLEWSLCASRTFDPGMSCEHPVAQSDTSLREWISPYLEAERERVTSLGRIANEVLGEHPPWLVNEASASESAGPRPAAP
ncbi:MAG TPA: protein-glutamine glutaminase family protein [Bdellovibrionota bacterium]|nr:protein-glutamine glutaminase family protein [Bdellovibrionota bacterium]